MPQLFAYTRLSTLRLKQELSEQAILSRMVHHAEGKKFVEFLEEMDTHS